MKRKGLTPDEALKLLDLYESAEEVAELINSESCPAILKQDGTAYSDDYDDLFDEEQEQIIRELKDAGSIEEFNKRRKARHNNK